MATNSQGNSKVKTVSMAAEMGEKAEERRKNLGLRTFSAYVQQLIKNDLASGGDLLIREKVVPQSGNYPPHRPHPLAVNEDAEKDSDGSPSNSSPAGKGDTDRASIPMGPSIHLRDKAMRKEAASARSRKSPRISKRRPSADRPPGAGTKK